jgi:HK97 family phage portal protein
MINWIRKIFSVNDPSVPLTAKNINNWFGFGNPSNAGVTVSEQSALGVPAFLKGVSLISNSIGKTPLHVFRKSDDGRDRATTHPADKLLNGKFNKYQSAFTGRVTIQKDALVYGNGYGWIERDELATPTAIWRLDPQATTPQMLDDGSLIYQTVINEEQRWILPENVFHIKGLGDGITGHPVLNYLSDAIGLGVAQQRYSARYFANNAIPPLAIKLKGIIKSDEAKEELRRSWQAIHGGGPTNAHKIALLEEGSELMPIAVDPVTSQLIESRKFTLIDFANLLGIPASWLGAAVNTSYKSLEHEDRAFLRDGLDSWMVQWEREADMKLLTERQQNLNTHYVEFIREAIIRMEIKDERAVLLSEYHGGIRSWESIRETLNLSTNKEGFYLRPSNLVVETFEEPEPEPEPVVVVEPTVEEEVEVLEETAQSTDFTITHDHRLEAITSVAIKRIFNRLEKSSKGKGQEWLEEMDKHKSIFMESLPVTDEDKLNKLWNDLKEELQAVSSKDWQGIWESKDYDLIAREICR